MHNFPKLGKFFPNEKAAALPSFGGERSARIATLGVGGKENQSRVQGLLGFLSGNRKNFNVLCRLTGKL